MVCVFFFVGGCCLAGVCGGEWLSSLVGLLIGGGFGCVNGGVGLMGFGVALVVGGGS